MSSTEPAKMTTFFLSPPHREGAALPQEHAQSAVESSMANARMATAIPTSLTGISIKKRRGFLKRRRVPGAPSFAVLVFAERVGFDSVSFRKQKSGTPKSALDIGG